MESSRTWRKSSKGVRRKCATPDAPSSAAIASTTPKSSSGTVHPDRVLANAGARAGDVLILTKPIGTGVISTALKRGIAEQAHVDASIHAMLTLNRAAAEALEGLEVHALTDVTGFGLLGHAREMARASGVTLEIEAARVPLLKGALEYAERGALPAGLQNNREFVGPCLEGSSPLDDLLYDPQTSGGLLISIAPADAGEYRRRFKEAVPIGRVTERGAQPLRVL